MKNAKDPNKFFFDKFTPIFEREARFSKKQPVPMLGSYEDSKETVEAFYDFWYNFDSWRSFEYLDKEVNEGSDRYAAIDSLNRCSMLNLCPAVTISVTPRRRTSRSALAARRRILPVCVNLWISL